MPPNPQNLGKPFSKGVSGNPSGRPKGALNFAAKIRKETDHGRELLKALLAIVRDPDAKDQDVINASKLLLDRLLGKSVQTIEANVTAVAGPNVDYSKLSDKEIEQLERIVTKAIAGSESPKPSDGSTSGAAQEKL